MCWDPAWIQLPRGTDKGVGWKEKGTGGCAHSFLLMWDSGHRVRVTAGFINIFELLEAPRVEHSNPISVLDIYQARKTVPVQRDLQWSIVIHGFLAFRIQMRQGFVWRRHPYVSPLAMDLRFSSLSL